MTYSGPTVNEECPTASTRKDPPVGRTRGLAVGGLVTALLLAAVGGGLWMLRGSGEQLRPTHPSTTYTLESMAPGETSFSLASMYLNEVGKEVEILDVMTLTSPNVEFLGALVVWPRDQTMVPYGGGPGYPAAEQGPHHAAFGVVIPAAETAFVPPGFDKPPPLMVTAGFRIRSGDLGAVNGVRVTYRADGTTKHEVFRQAIIGCVKPNPCENPKGRDPSEFANAALRRFGLLPED